MNTQSQWVLLTLDRMREVEKAFQGRGTCQCSPISRSERVEGGKNAVVCTGKGRHNPGWLGGPDKYRP